MLAQQAVRGAMAGYSGMVVGKVDVRYVMFPIHAITKHAVPRRGRLRSRPFKRRLSTTGQPNLAPGIGDDWALLPPAPHPKPHVEVPAPPEALELLEFKCIDTSREV